MEKLQKIIERCKNSVSIRINDHRDNYKTVRQKLDEIKILSPDDYDDISEKTINKMIENDTLIEFYIYPDTSVGSYVWYHYDIEKIVNEAFEVLKLK